MGFISSSFSNLIFNATGMQLGANAALNATNYKKRGNQLVFVSPRGYDNVYVYAAKRTMMQMSFATINDLYPKYLRQNDLKRAKDKYKSKEGQGPILQKVIENGKNADENKSKKQNVSIKYRGKPANEALVLWIQSEKNATPIKVKINTYWDKVKLLSGAQKSRLENKRNGVSIIEDTELSVPTDNPEAVFCDLGPNVSMQGGNNIIQTKVQGRDFSRKEMISAEDITFTVKGKIVSNYPDVYPYEDVSRFVTLMQHKGVIQVHNILFQQMNVTQIVIKDFSMGQNEGFKNVQPYSFTCVAVEPDEEVKVVKDTLEVVNLKIKDLDKKHWSKVILDNVKKSAANQAAQMLEQLTSQVI